MSRDRSNDWARWPNLLPWEKRPDEPETGKPNQVHSTDRTPLLFGPDGKPLAKRRPLGFRPEDAR